MVDQERWAESRRLCNEERVSIAEIGRRLDLDRKTVRRSLRQTTWQPYRRAAVVETLLTADADFVQARAPQVGYSTRILYQELRKSRERLDALLQEAAAKDLSYADFLDQVLGEEVAAKAEKNITMRTSLARFPFVKSLEAFDFTYQPSLDKKHIQQVATCDFIEHGENIVMLGPPGVDKSHPGDWAGAQSDRAGLPRVVHHRGRHDRDAHPGAHGESAGR
jgi:hypothetical protein